MGMYDTIVCKMPLPELPQLVVDYWGDQLSFQTKGTPNQALDTYLIDKDGTVYEMDKGDKFLTSFSDIVHFYTNYPHPEDKSGDDYSVVWAEPQRFVDGWIEYVVTIQGGQVVGDIELYNHRIPEKRTDEELAALAAELEARREQYKQNRILDRKETTKPELILIDKIYEIVKDSSHDLVKMAIEEFREQHDIYYRP